MTKHTITLRLDKDVYDAVKERAFLQHRSRNGQINYELGQTRKEYSETDMIDWALEVIKRKGNPPYLLEDTRIQLDRELKKFKMSRI